MKTNVSISMSPEQLAVLRVTCRDLNISVSAYVLRALDDWCHIKSVPGDDYNSKHAPGRRFYRDFRAELSRIVGIRQPSSPADAAAVKSLAKSSKATARRVTKLAKGANK